MAYGSQSMPEAAPRHEAEPTTPAVLVVEEEFMIRVLIADYLQECGFKAITANDALQAITIIEAGKIKIDVVLANARIPDDANGGLARWIGANRPDIKIIVATGDHQKSAAAKELCEEGPLKKKPYDLNVVVARIRAVLNKLKL